MTMGYSVSTFLPEMPSGRPFWFFYDVTVVFFFKFCDVIDDVIDFPEPLGL